MDKYESLILEGITDKRELLLSFFHREQSPDEGRYPDNERKEAGIKMLALIRETPIEEIFELVNTTRPEEYVIETNHIPQFSNIDDVDRILDIAQANPGADRDLMGYFFNRDGSLMAQRKYGENHYKMAAEMGLVVWGMTAHLTPLGEAYRVLPHDERTTIRAKLILRIPIVQRVLYEAQYGPVYPLRVLREYLSPSTAKRRHSNLLKSVTIVCNALPNGQALFDNFVWMTP